MIKINYFYSYSPQLDDIKLLKELAFWFDKTKLKRIFDAIKHRENEIDNYILKYYNVGSGEGATIEIEEKRNENYNTKRI